MAADHGELLQQASLGRCQPVYSCEDRTLNGIRDLDVDFCQDRASVHDGKRSQFQQRLQQLLDEEGVSLCPRRDDPLEIFW